MGVAHGEGLAGKRPSADNCGEQLVFLQTGQKESDVLRPHPQIPGHTVPVDVVHPAGVMGEVVIQKQLERPHRQRVGREGQGDPASPVGVDKLDEMTFPFAQAGTGLGGDQPIQERLGIGMKHHPVDRLKVKGIIV